METHATDTKHVVRFDGIKLANPIAVAGQWLTLERLDAILSGWHEAGRADHDRLFKNVSYDAYHMKKAVVRRKYILLDDAGSGVFMVDRETGEVYGIKGYGKVHHGHHHGNILSLLDPAGPAWFWEKGDWYGRSR